MYFNRDFLIMNENYITQMKNKFTVFFAIVLLGFIIFISILFYWTKIDRNLPKLITSDTNFAIRGNIVSADGFVLASSQKLYKAMVDTRNISPEKKELFINLYSIYSGDDPKKVKERIESRQGNVVLSYRVDSKTAEHLQVLAKKLFKLGVFTSYEDLNTKTVSIRGMSITESGEVRSYPYNDFLTPTLGYVKKVEHNSFTRVAGVKGLERFYEDRLAPIQDSYLLGFRDIAGVIILNKDSKAKNKIDGYNIEITIPVKLQKSIENILSKAQQEYEAKEVITIIMRSNTGELLSFATSNRYNINAIKQDDYAYLNINAVEYIYEPGSVMKPIIYATLLQNGKIDPNEIINTYGGVFKLGKYKITDEIKKDWISAEDVITYSSNIGMSQLAQRLDGSSYYKGLVDFGFGENTNIDLTRELKGNLQSAHRLNSEVYKATISYGYGMSVNFMQLVRAFNVFNNDGKIITPKIGSHIIDKSGKKYKIDNNPEYKIISSEVAQKVKNTLIKVIKKGSGKKAQVDGIEVGGKTGTAHIAAQGAYHSFYNSSFVGFANDEFNNKYTIGVLVIEPTAPGYKYFGSQSAAPIFKDIVEEMIEQDYLQLNDK